MYFRIDNEKLLEKYKIIWTKIEDFIFNALPVYDERYVRTKIRTYGDNVYTNFCDLNIPDDDIECECFTVVSITCLRKKLLPASKFKQLCL